MALDILRDPEGSGLPELISPDQSELTLAGLWWLAAENMAQRPAVCATATHAGMFAIGMAAMRKSSPTEWISWRTPAALLAAGPLAMPQQPLAVPCQQLQTPQQLLVMPQERLLKPQQTYDII